eukprot:gene10196-7144_t
MSKPEQKSGGGKWVSNRVQLHKSGKKVEEETVVAPTKTKDTKEAPEVTNTGFERQEATDTLSNLSHYSTPLKDYKPAASSRLPPAPNADTFHERFMEKIKKKLRGGDTRRDASPTPEARQRTNSLAPAFFLYSCVPNAAHECSSLPPTCRTVLPFTSFSHFQMTSLNRQKASRLALPRKASRTLICFHCNRSKPLFRPESLSSSTEAAGSMSRSAGRALSGVAAALGVGAGLTWLYHQSNEQLVLQELRRLEQGPRAPILRTLLSILEEAKRLERAVTFFNQRSKHTKQQQHTNKQNKNKTHTQPLRLRTLMGHRVVRWRTRGGSAASCTSIPTQSRLCDEWRDLPLSLSLCSFVHSPTSSFAFLSIVVVKVCCGPGVVQLCLLRLVPVPLPHPSTMSEEEGIAPPPATTEERENRAAESIVRFMRMVMAKKAKKTREHSVVSYLDEKCAAEQPGSDGNSPGPLDDAGAAELQPAQEPEAEENDQAMQEDTEPTVSEEIVAQTNPEQEHEAVGEAEPNEEIGVEAAQETEEASPEQEREAVGEAEPNQEIGVEAAQETEEASPEQEREAVGEAEPNQEIGVEAAQETEEASPEQEREAVGEAEPNQEIGVEVAQETEEASPEQEREAVGEAEPNQEIGVEAAQETEEASPEQEREAVGEAEPNQEIGVEAAQETEEASPEQEREAVGEAEPNQEIGVEAAQETEEASPEQEREAVGEAEPNQEIGVEVAQETEEASPEQEREAVGEAEPNQENGVEAAQETEEASPEQEREAVGEAEPNQEIGVEAAQETEEASPEQEREAVGEAGLADAEEPEPVREAAPAADRPYDIITYDTEDDGNVGTEVAQRPELGMEDVRPEEQADNVGTEVVEPKEKPDIEGIDPPAAPPSTTAQEMAYEKTNPSHGCQAGVAEEQPAQEEDASPPQPKVKYIEVEKQEAQGEVVLTATVQPMGFKIRKTLRVSRFAPGSIPEDRMDGAEPDEGWVLVAKDVFEALGAAMSVHPQSFYLFRGSQRVRFVDALFLDRDLYADDSATRAEPLWLDVGFPEDTDVPSHLCQIRPNEVLIRCVTVHREPPEMPTAVLAEGKRRGLTYDEVIARIYAEAEDRGEAKWTTVAIVHDGTGFNKPFLGGYCVKKDRSRVCYHASTQLFMKGFNYSPASHRPPVDDLLSRRTQTWGVTRSCQTRRECCVTTPCKELVVDYSRLFKVVARPYFYASSLLTLKTEKTIILQKCYRQWKARKIRQQLEAEDAEKQHRAEARQIAEEAAKLETDSREQLRRDDPRTQEDFDRLKQEVMGWINAENRKIVQNTGLSPEKKRAALLALNNQELKMLQDLENRRRTIMLLQKDRRFAVMFEKMSAPKMWGSVAVRTPETERAAELRGLYLTLVDPHLPTSGRLDVLLHIKWTVKEFNAPLTRELCQLIDREADLLNRGRREASLSGLRFRIETLFKRFIEDPEYNPGMAEYTRSAVGRAKARSLYGTVYDEKNRMTVDPALQESTSRTNAFYPYLNSVSAEPCPFPYALYENSNSNSRSYSLYIKLCLYMRAERLTPGGKELGLLPIKRCSATTEGRGAADTQAAGPRSRFPTGHCRRRAKLSRLLYIFFLFLLVSLFIGTNRRHTHTCEEGRGLSRTHVHRVFLSLLSTRCEGFRPPLSALSSLSSLSSFPCCAYVISRHLPVISSSNKEGGNSTLSAHYVTGRIKGSPTEEKRQRHSSTPCSDNPSTDLRRKRSRSPESSAAVGHDDGANAGTLPSREAIAGWRSSAAAGLDATLRRLATGARDARGFPAPLQTFLVSCAADGLPETEQTENNLLRELIAAGDEAHVADAVSAGPALPPDVEKRAVLAWGLWFLLAAEWRAAVTGQLDGRRTLDFAGQRVEGYSYAVYSYAQRRAIAPEDEAIAVAVARAAAAWQENCRLRRAAFHLLACVYHDFRALQTNKGKSANTNLEEVCVVPRQLLDGMFDLVVVHLQREGSSRAARQRYADLVLGNANWKLGLFSGGEVHMRRSMERVERHRIFHLLNNERAMALLHVLSRWISFYERHLGARYKALFRGGIEDTINHSLSVCPSLASFPSSLACLPLDRCAFNIFHSHLSPLSLRFLCLCLCLCLCVGYCESRDELCPFGPSSPLQPRDPRASLTGEVRVEVIKTVKCRSVQLRVRGEEEVRRREQTTTVTLEVDPNARAKSLLLCCEVVLLQGPNGEAVIPSRCPFQSILGRPPSFFMYVEKGCAWMRYWVEIVFDVPRGFDAQASAPFTVIGAVPCSVYNHRRLTPVTTEHAVSEVSDGGCCLPSWDPNPIETVVELLQTVLVAPPDTAPYSAAPPPLPDQLAPHTTASTLQPLTSPSGRLKVGAVRVAPLTRVYGRAYPTASVDYVPPNGCIAPNEHLICGVLLGLGQPLCTVQPPKYKQGEPARPVPTFRTPLCSSGTLLRATFPNLQTENTLASPNRVEIDSLRKPVTCGDGVPREPSGPVASAPRRCHHAAAVTRGHPEGAAFTRHASDACQHLLGGRTSSDGCTWGEVVANSIGPARSESAAVRRPTQLAFCFGSNLDAEKDVNASTPVPSNPACFLYRLRWRPPWVGGGAGASLCCASPILIPTCFLIIYSPYYYFDQDIFLFQLFRHHSGRLGEALSNTNTNTNTSLPQQKPGVPFLKYQHTGVPKNKERLFVGRSNRANHEAQKSEALEHLFVQKKSSERLPVGERHSTAYHKSDKYINDIMGHRRHIAHLLRGEVVPANESSAIQPPPSPPPPAPSCLVAAQYHVRELMVHPTVNFLKRQNRHGKGHQIAPENYFLASATPLYTTPPDNPHNTYPQRPFLIPDGKRQLAYGAGTLEYNDPAWDEFSHNPVVSRFDVSLDPYGYYNAKGEPIKIPWADVRDEAKKYLPALPESSCCSHNDGQHAAADASPAHQLSVSASESSGNVSVPVCRDSLAVAPEKRPPHEKSARHSAQSIHSSVCGSDHSTNILPTPLPLSDGVGRGAGVVTPCPYGCCGHGLALSVQSQSDTNQESASSHSAQRSSAPALRSPAASRSPQSESICESVESRSTQPSAAAPLPQSPPPFPPHDKSEYENHLGPGEQWVRDFVPNVRPWEVPPFLGRCGYKDTRLTFDRVQAGPNAAMHPTPKEHTGAFDATPTCPASRHAHRAQPLPFRPRENAILPLINNPEGTLCVRWCPRRKASAFIVPLHVNIRITLI